MLETDLLALRLGLWLVRVRVVYLDDVIEQEYEQGQCVLISETTILD